MTDTRPLSLRLYALAARAASPLAPLLLARRARRGKEDPARLGERLGGAGKARPEGILIWMHGASVGEGLSLLPLADRLLAARPDASVLVTTGTRASAQILGQRLRGQVFHQFAPIDTPGAVAAFLAHWRPDLAVFVESELWPNLILATRASGARMALVSARLSPASFGTWRRFPAAARTTLGAFELIFSRDRAAAERFHHLGVPTQGVADMKLGASPLPVDPGEYSRQHACLIGRPVILAASTHSGEEPLILRRFSAMGPAARESVLIIVPRHADRGGDVAQLASDVGFAVARRSAGQDSQGAQVYVADTLGELGLWYRLATLAIVGGSLVEGIGGHNPLEPARLDCPFVSGPHVEGWPVYEDLAAARATRLLAGAEDMEAAIHQAINDPGSLAPMAGRARAFVEARDGENDALVGRLTDLLAR